MIERQVAQLTLCGGRLIGREPGGLGQTSSRSGANGFGKFIRGTAGANGFGKFIRGTAEDLRSGLANQGLTLDVQSPGHRMPILGDAERLSQIVINLIGNAGKFYKPSGRITLGVIPDSATSRA